MPASKKHLSRKRKSRRKHKLHSRKYKGGDLKSLFGISSQAPRPSHASHRSGSAASTTFNLGCRDKDGISHDTGIPIPFNLPVQKWFANGVCPPGTSPDIKCPPGYHMNSETNICEECEIGYKKNSEAGQCVPVSQKPPRPCTPRTNMNEMIDDDDNTHCVCKFGYVREDPNDPTSKCVMPCNPVEGLNEIIDPSDVTKCKCKEGLKRETNGNSNSKCVSTNSPKPVVNSPKPNTNINIAVNMPKKNTRPHVDPHPRATLKSLSRNASIAEHRGNSKRVSNNLRAEEEIKQMSPHTHF